MTVELYYYRCPLCNKNKTGKVHFFRGKAISITYPDYVFVALVTGRQGACAVLSSDACPAVQYFSYCLINETILVKEVTE